jgi:hypothetical protein
VSHLFLALKLHEKIRLEILEIELSLIPFFLVKRIHLSADYSISKLTESSYWAQCTNMTEMYLQGFNLDTPYYMQPFLANFQ